MQTAAVCCLLNKGSQSIAVHVLAFPTYAKRLHLGSNQRKGCLTSHGIGQKHRHSIRAVL